MNASVKLETPKFPKAISDLIHSNQFLKMFAIVASGISTLSMTALLAMVYRAPVIITLSQSAEVLNQVAPPKPEDDLKMAVRRYLDQRYNWDPATVNDHLKNAEAFVGSAALSAYEKAAVNVAKFSVDKQVTQRIFPDQPVVNIESKKAMVTGTRVTAVQGIRAAGDLKLELTLEYGPRTKQNPWGVYIVKENEM
jgi:hypothetical protein